MSVATLKKTAKRGHRRLAVMPVVAPRSVTFAKAQVRELATQGQRLAGSVDGQIKEFTGRRSAAWFDGVSRLASDHRWIASGLAAFALYALFALLV